MKPSNLGHPGLRRLFNFYVSFVELVFAGADELGGGTGIDAPGFERTGGDGGQAEDGSFGERHAGADDGAGADPGVRADGHFVGEEGESRVVEVVGGSAKVGALRDDGVRAEMHGSGVVDFGAVGDGDQVAAVEVPGGPDSGAGIDAGVGADFCAEKAEQGGSPGVQGAGGEAEEEGVGDVPGEALEAAGAGKGGAQVGVGVEGGVDMVGGVVGGGSFHEGWGG